MSSSSRDVTKLLTQSSTSDAKDEKKVETKSTGSTVSKVDPQLEELNQELVRVSADLNADEVKYYLFPNPQEPTFRPDLSYRHSGFQNDTALEVACFPAAKIYRQASIADKPGLAADYKNAHTTIELLLNAGAPITDKAIILSKVHGEATALTNILLTERTRRKNVQENAEAFAFLLGTKADSQSTILTLVNNSIFDPRLLKAILAHAHETTPSKNYKF